MTSPRPRGRVVLVPSVVSGILSAGPVSSGSSAATAKVPSKASPSRSPSSRDARRSKPLGRAPQPAIVDDVTALRTAKPSAALRTTSSPSVAVALTSRAQRARSQQIEQRRAQPDELLMRSEKGSPDVRASSCEEYCAGRCGVGLGSRIPVCERGVGEVAPRDLPGHS